MAASGGSQAADAQSAVKKKAKKKAKKRTRRACAKGLLRMATTGKCVRGTAVHVYLLEGTFANLDFGGGVMRPSAMSGKAVANIPQTVVDLMKPVPFKVDSIAVNLAPVDLGIPDPNCAGKTISSRTISVTQDPNKASTGSLTLNANGGEVVVGPNVIFRTVAEMHSPDCGPMVATGYVDSRFSQSARGKPGREGFNRLMLQRDPRWTSFDVCTTPGDPSKPCTGTPTHLTVMCTGPVFLKVRVCLSGKCPSDVV